MTVEKITELKKLCDDREADLAVGRGLAVMFVADIRQLLTLAEDAERMRRMKQCNPSSWRTDSIVKFRFDTEAQAVAFWTAWRESLTAPAAGADK